MRELLIGTIFPKSESGTIYGIRHHKGGVFASVSELDKYLTLAECHEKSLYEERAKKRGINEENSSGTGACVCIRAGCRPIDQRVGRAHAQTYVFCFT
jgi:hypothetical protein